MTQHDTATSRTFLKVTLRMLNMLNESCWSTTMRIQTSDLPILLSDTLPAEE